MLNVNVLSVIMPKEENENIDTFLFTMFIMCFENIPTYIHA